ncbi:outer membrane porin GjpA [Mycolicibacter icosiumassiliensis]|uniref:outer membrane porin GjpA n=1 Tax=Mycolicibacter icosiumassiliensis TaxID=1792835 RepID=UPI00098F6BD7|nr:outer membrane porin GjpA [Mycolicibacter icosiumassiliensis]
MPAKSERHNTTNTKETAVRHTLRPYATVGVALVGAGLFAATPVAAPVPDLNTIRAVALTAGESDLFAPWIAQYNTASENASILLNNFMLAPGVGLQQSIANQIGFIQQVLNDPSNISTWMNETQSNLGAVLTGYGLQNASPDTTSTVLDHTLEGSISNGHAVLFGEIPGYIPADEQAAAEPIINWLGSPSSAIFMGAIGPWISPWVALANSLTDGDDVNTTLANMVGAFFNGATLNLDSLLPAINSLGLFPPGMTMQNLDIGFGGLLSTGSVQADPYDVGGYSIPAVGGSLFNSVGIQFAGVPVVSFLTAPSEAIGPLGAWEAWAQIAATLIGWDGTDSPLAGVVLPAVPDELADGGTAVSTSADDLSGFLQDVVSWFGLSIPS